MFRYKKILFLIVFLTIAWENTDMDAKAQQQTLSIRISDTLREFLERAKEMIASGRGESVSTSDVAKILLESAKDDRLDFRLEAAELQRSPTQSLCSIRRKWDQRQDLSRAEWFFLSYYIQIGCEELSENPEMPTSDSFADLLEAILAVRALRTRGGVRLDHYYLSNLGPDASRPLNERQIDPEIVPEVFAKVIGKLRERSPFSQPTFAGRIFNVAVRDEELPNIVALNRALFPHMSTLFRLAARGHWIRERRPVRKSENEGISDDIPAVKRKGFRLSSAVSGDGEVLLLLDMEEKDAQYTFGPYPEIREFVVMLERLEHCGTWRGTYYHAGTIPETPDKPKRFYFRSRTGCVTFGFSVEEWQRLKSLFTAALATPELRRFFSELSLIYGEL